ncbi:hypothetical protein D9M72_361880 [compost metagenome]
MGHPIALDRIDNGLGLGHGHDDVGAATGEVQATAEPCGMRHRRHHQVAGIVVVGKMRVEIAEEGVDVAMGDHHAL